MLTKENTELPKTDAPAPEIPHLKMRKEERKKAGAAWGSGRPAGGAFEGAAGGGARAAAGVARAAASAARGFGAGAAAEAAAGAAAKAGLFANLFSGASAWLSAATATLAGKLAVMAVAALVAGMGVVGGYRLIQASRRGGAGSASPDLGGISSTRKVDRILGDAGLGYSPSGGGLLRSDDPSGIAASGAPVEDTGGLPPEGANAAEELRNGGPLADKMEHNLSGAKLSSSAGGKTIAAGGALAGVSVGGGSAGSLKNLADSGSIGKFGQGANKSGKGGVLTAKNVRKGSGMQLRHLSSTPSRTLALLRGMASRYNPAIRSGNKVTEANATAASEQFEASELLGATPPTSPTDQDPGGGGGGGGGGSGTAGTQTGGYTTNIDGQNCDYEAGAYWNGSACVSMDTQGKNDTPWQVYVDAARVLAPLSAVLLALACYFWQVGNAIPSIGPAMQYLACQIATIVSGVLALLLGVCGLVISQMGGGMVGYYMMGLSVAQAGLATWVYMIPDGASLSTAMNVCYVNLIAGLLSAFLPTGL